MNIVVIIGSIIFWLFEGFLLINVFLGIVGLFRQKRKYEIIDDKQKFCIFVPCHNEGPVVESTVLNYTEIQYNKDLFDIYFIADNCTDNTAEILQNTVTKSGCTNFHVLVRNVDDPNKKGKPHALKWAMEILESEDKFYNKYDQFMIFDADNFVDPDILKHVNSQYLSYKVKKRPVMIQCYLDSKNKNSLVARSYYTCYRISNRTAQAARNTLGLVPAIGGTGFAMSTKFLKDIGGYNCKSLTEDLEIQCIATMRNERIVFNEFARVYDEKPTGVKQSLVQRTRWSQGHWYLCFKYTWRLFFSLFNFKTIKNTFRKLDLMFYLNSMFFIGLSVVSFLFQTGVSIYSYYANDGVNYLNAIIGCGYGAGNMTFANVVIIANFVILCFTLFVLLPITALYDGKEAERKTILKEYIPNVISLVVLSILQTLCVFSGLVKCGNQKVWKKTAHNVTTMKSNKEEKIA